MPTISQLPTIMSVSAADEVPISHGGSACATTVGVLLASAQPAIIVQSPALLGRTSIGSGGPEQINVGRADQAFDDMDNLRDESLTATLKTMVRRLIELASVMPRTAGDRIYDAD